MASWLPAIFPHFLCCSEKHPLGMSSKPHFRARLNGRFVSQPQSEADCNPYNYLEACLLLQNHQFSVSLSIGPEVISFLQRGILQFYAWRCTSSCQCWSIWPSRVYNTGFIPIPAIYPKIPTVSVVPLAYHTELSIHVKHQSLLLYVWDKSPFCALPGE